MQSTLSKATDESIHDTPQASAWKGEFGNDYIERNLPDRTKTHQRVKAFTEMLAPTAGDEPQSILECGTNIGLNLRALRHITEAQLYAVEPNDNARQILVKDGVVPKDHAHAATLGGLPFDDGCMDLVFTSGVLIHVAPQDLEQAYHEIYRVSGKYILTLEYFSKHPETIKYRGQDDLLWKRDFGGMWLDLYPDLLPLAHGFFWQRTTGLDDPTWWLFRKRD